MEFNAYWLEQAGTNAQQVTDFLESFGYQPYLIGERPPIFSPLPRSLPELCNVLFKQTQ